jgi:hypothetical protein
MWDFLYGQRKQWTPIIVFHNSACG